MFINPSRTQALTASTGRLSSPARRQGGKNVNYMGMLPSFYVEQLL
jgi:hypothetical protein